MIRQKNGIATLYTLRTYKQRLPQAPAHEAPLQRDGGVMKRAPRLRSLLPLFLTLTEGFPLSEGLVSCSPGVGTIDSSSSGVSAQYTQTCANLREWAAKLSPSPVGGVWLAVLPPSL